VVGSVGALPAYGAYFWGQGGNLIWITYDEGMHWRVASFSLGVQKVSQSRGTFSAVVISNIVRERILETALFQSTDSGRIWNYRHRLPNLQ